MKPQTARRIDYLILALTVLAALPYELGSVATIIPPELKPWVVAAGVIAKLVLSEIKNQLAMKQEAKK